MLKIKRIGTSSECKALENYILNKQGTGYADRIAWAKVLCKSFGIKSGIFVAHDQHRFVGYLILFVNRRLNLRKHAVTGPLSSSGGGVYGETAEAELALLDAARKYAGMYGLDYIHIRMNRELKSKPEGWRYIDDVYSTHIMDLKADADHVWQSVFRAKTRNQVRKALRYNYNVKIGHRYIDEFHAVLNRGVKELGSPCPGKKLFLMAAKLFKHNVDFIVVKDGGTSIAGTVLFFHQDMVSNPWAVTLKAYRSQCVNSLLYWEIVKLASNRNMQFFDLGRSMNLSSNAKFKKRIGAKSHPLHYYFYMLKDRHAPKFTKEGKLERIIKSVWTNLPDPITSSMGNTAIKQVI